jgi:hypothetical protein
MGNKGLGYKVLGFLVWKSWMRVLRHESQATRDRLRSRRMLIGAGIVVTAVAAGAVVIRSQRGTPQ